MKRTLSVLLALVAASSVYAGTQIIDGSSNAVFTDLAGNGSLGALNSAVTLTLRGQGKATVQVVSVSGTQTLSWEGTVDNANWFAVNGVVPTTGAAAASTAAAGQWEFDVSSLVGFRVRCSAYTSGAASVFVNASLQAAVTTLANPLPAGSNIVGALVANQSVNVNQVAGATTSTAASGVLKAGVVGNAGAAFDAANNAAAPANVLVAGAQLQSGASATVGTAGQVGSPVAGLDHVLFARIGGPVNWSCFVEAATTTTQCRTAPAAGVKAYVTSIACSNEAATAQGVDVVFGTGAACVTGTTALTHKFAMGTNATTTSPFVVSHTFEAPLNPTAANAVCVRPTSATAFGCTLTGYDAP